MYKYEELDQHEVMNEVRWSYPERDEAVVNVPLLRKHVDWVKEQAALEKRGFFDFNQDKHWNQESWIIAASMVKHADTQMMSCKTGCCLAGNVALEDPDATLLVHNKTIWGVRDTDGQMYSVGAFAAHKLGATEYDCLFSGGNSAEDIEIVATRMAKRAGDVL